MSTHTIKGFITYKAPRWSDDKPTVGFVDFKPNETSAWGVIVREHSIEVEIPEDFDPRPLQVAALEEKKRQARADFAAAIVEYDRQINELLAIENAS